MIKVWEQLRLPGFSVNELPLLEAICGAQSWLKMSLSDRDSKEIYGLSFRTVGTEISLKIYELRSFLVDIFRFCFTQPPSSNSAVFAVFSGHFGDTNTITALYFQLDKIIQGLIGILAPNQVHQTTDVLFFTSVLAHAPWPF
jgi:hypothetical protein